MVEDIYPDFYVTSSPTDLTVVNNILYFAANDGINGIELWKVEVPPPSPCPNSLVIQSPPASPPIEGIDFTGNTSTIRRANASGGSIIANNKILDNANVVYEASSIQLTPGFVAANGTIFKAQIGGCN